MLFAIALVLAAGSARAAKNHRDIDTNTSSGDTIITHIADGGDWKTTITIVNLSSTKAAAFTLNFYGDDGAPKTFPWVGIGSHANVTGTLAPAGEMVLETAGTAVNTSQGWGQFDYSSSGDISGYAIFTNKNGQEATVPFESEIVQQQALAFDNSNGHTMGVALVNSNSLAVLKVAAVFCDGDGKIIGTDIFTMKPLVHTSFILRDRWPFTANRRATVSFWTDSWGLAVLGLRVNSVFALTSVHALETHD